MKLHISSELLLSYCPVKTLMGQKASGYYFFSPKIQRPGHLRLKNIEQLLFVLSHFVLSEVLALILLAEIQFR